MVRLWIPWEHSHRGERADVADLVATRAALLRVGIAARLMFLKKGALKPFRVCMSFAVRDRGWHFEVISRSLSIARRFPLLQIGS